MTSKRPKITMAQLRAALADQSDYLKSCEAAHNSLAEPVLPAGGDVEAPKRLPVRMPEGRSLPAGHATAWNDACTAWEAYVAKVMQPGLEAWQKGREGMRAERDVQIEHVTRLQAEVFEVRTALQVANKNTKQIMAQRDALQSELTKARELLTADYQLLGLNSSLVSYREQMKAIATFLSNQSAPADKTTRAQRVEQLNQEIATLLAQDDHE